MCWSGGRRLRATASSLTSHLSRKGACRGGCDSLRRYHLNVVQFYDWMWRHYALMPPTEEFTDALGRKQSLGTVRAAIEAVQEAGARRWPTARCTALSRSMRISIPN